MGSDAETNPRVSHMLCPFLQGSESLVVFAFRCLGSRGWGRSLLLSLRVPSTAGAEHSTRSEMQAPGTRYKHQDKLQAPGVRSRQQGGNASTKREMQVSGGRCKHREPSSPWQSTPPGLPALLKVVQNKETNKKLCRRKGLTPSPEMCAAALTTAPVSFMHPEGGFGDAASSCG